MGITKNFVYILGFGLLIMPIGINTGNSLTLFIIYNIICFALLFIDYYISSGEKGIYAERKGEDKLSILEKEAVVITLYNKSEYKLNLELKDEVPEFHFKTEEELIKGKILPHEKKEFKYYVVPLKRGAFKFGILHIRLEGRLKLCKRQFSIDLNKEYKVYPNLKNLRKYRLSIANNRQLKQGQRNLQMLGTGTSFESLREYVNGDEYRKINWKATARESKPIVNQYEPEKNQHVYMFIDTGRPMSYTIRGNRKLDMAVNTALILSDIVNQNGDQSALLLFNIEVNNMIAPGKGPGHRNKMLEALYHVDCTKDTSNYEAAFYHFKRKERHRSIIFIFTDFETIEEAEDILRVLPVISKNNIVVIMLMKNETLETIALEKAKGSQEMFHKGAALEFLEERRKIISLLNKRGIFCIECASEKLEFSAINQYIHIKNRSYI